LIDDAAKVPTAGELYAGLEHFTNEAGDGAQYDISGDMEDIFQVILLDKKNYTFYLFIFNYCSVVYLILIRFL